MKTENTTRQLQIEGGNMITPEEQEYKDSPWAFLELADGARVSLFDPKLTSAVGLQNHPRPVATFELPYNDWKTKSRSRL